jgi:hypothetical protein
MMIHFVFVGLVAFVHATPGGPLEALLVDTTDLWRASDGITVPHHEAFVAVNRAAVVGNVCPNEAHVDPAKLCSWLLHHEDVTVEGAIQATGTEKNTIAHMKAVLPQAEFVKGHSLDPEPDRTLLIGRFDLAAARLQSLSLCNADADFHPIGRPTPDDQERDVGEVAWVEATANSNITLRLKKFGSLGSGRSIQIDKNHEAFIVIGNKMPEGDLKTCDPVKDRGKFFDRHFEMFYTLAAYEPWSHERPVPFSCCTGLTLTEPTWMPGLLKDLLVPEKEFKLHEEGIYQRIICPMAIFSPPS